MVPVNSCLALSIRCSINHRCGGWPVQQSEYVCEIYYKLHTMPGIYIQPNIQYIHNPGGITRNKDVVISGLKLSVRL